MSLCPQLDLKVTKTVSLFCSRVVLLRYYRVPGVYWVLINICWMRKWFLLSHHLHWRSNWVWESEGLGKVKFPWHSVEYFPLSSCLYFSFLFHSRIPISSLAQKVLNMTSVFCRRIVSCYYLSEYILDPALICFVKNNENSVIKPLG